MATPSRGHGAAVAGRPPPAWDCLLLLDATKFTPRFIQQSFGFESQNAEDGGNGVYDEPGFGAQTVQPFVAVEMREATQEEIELATQLDAAQNAQYALQDQDELIEQVPQHYSHILRYACICFPGGRMKRRS